MVWVSIKLSSKIFKNLKVRILKIWENISMNILNFFNAENFVFAHKTFSFHINFFFCHSHENFFLTPQKIFLVWQIISICKILSTLTVNLTTNSCKPYWICSTRVKRSIFIINCVLNCCLVVSCKHTRMNKFLLSLIILKEKFKENPLISMCMRIDIWKINK